MASMLVSLTLALASGATAWAGSACTNPAHHHGNVLRGGGQILAPGPGFGYGFPNGNPDGYGWWDHGTALPLDANRTAEYYFPRYYSLPPTQMFLQNYYNPYITRGQRYVAFTNCGGNHPAGGPPTGSANTPVHPYQETIGTGPRVALPAFTGRADVPPVQPGGSGLTP
jgi:hypothetical protein